MQVLKECSSEIAPILSYIYTEQKKKKKKKRNATIGHRGFLSLRIKRSGLLLCDFHSCDIRVYHAKN